MTKEGFLSGKTEVLRFRVTPYLKAQLTYMAQFYGVTMTQILQEGLELRIEKFKKDTHDGFKKIEDKYKESPDERVKKEMAKLAEIGDFIRDNF